MRSLVGVAAFIACLAVGLIYVRSLEPGAVFLDMAGGILRRAPPGWALSVALAALVAVLTAIYLAPSTEPTLATSRRGRCRGGRADDGPRYASLDAREAVVALGVARRYASVPA